MTDHPRSPAPEPNNLPPAPPLATHTLTLALASLDTAIDLLLHLNHDASADTFLDHYALLTRHLPQLPHPRGLWSERRNLVAAETALRRAVELMDAEEVGWTEEAKELEVDVEAWRAGVRGSGSGSEDGMSTGSSGGG